jgi:mannose-1-phosphate guanylyltransferase
MQIILLSGGSGKRLWPMSNDVRSKQFLKILSDENGNSQSMIQRVCKQIMSVYPNVNVTIASNTTQVDSIKSQLGDDIDIVLEPERRDTFPAIVLACAHLASKGINSDETVVVMPCDPFTELEFFKTIYALDKLISTNNTNIALIGIKPLFATSKYGYIIPSSVLNENAYMVSRFIEKPPENIATKLIKKGAYWNSGVFAFKLGHLLEIAKSDVSFDSCEDLISKYSELEKISFDYKVVEKSKHVAVVPFNGTWSDIGTWRTLADVMPVTVLGTVTQEDSKNTFIVNELGIPLIALGMKDCVIAACPDGILVSDIEQSSFLKPLVDKLEQARHMYEERRWGEYTVLSQTTHSLVKNIYIKSGKSISLQAHAHRSEVWVITSGEGIFILESETRAVGVGDVLQIERNKKHKIEAITDLYFTEVQLVDKI